MRTASIRFGDVDHDAVRPVGRDVEIAIGMGHLRAFDPQSSQPAIGIWRHTPARRAPIRKVVFSVDPVDGRGLRDILPRDISKLSPVEEIARDLHSGATSHTYFSIALCGQLVNHCP